MRLRGVASALDKAGLPLFSQPVLTGIEGKRAAVAELVDAQR